MPSTLYLVATPIGNLSDVSERALQTLRSVDAIICEDTRVTARLLAKFAIRRPLVSFHQHSDAKELVRILERLRKGESLACVSDAGTPGVSDPGEWLVEQVLKELPEVQIVPIPGPSALTCALSVCGFPADRFVFFGFPPAKKGRKTFFESVCAESRTSVLYESTHRIEKTLEELSLLGDRRIVLCRELTKLHETIYRGTVTQVTDALHRGSIKGEFVLVLAPH